MKSILIIILLFNSLSIFSQEIVFRNTGETNINGNTPYELYSCKGELINNSNENLVVVYNRNVIEIPTIKWKSALCTDEYCYSTTTNTVIEEIKANSTHNVEIRWVIDEKYETIDTGYTEWEILMEDSGRIIDTFNCQIVFDPNEGEREINVYPNPANSEIHFRVFKNSIVVIYDHIGAIHFSDSVHNGLVDVSNIKPGTYFGKVYTENQRYSFRFTKL